MAGPEVEILHRAAEGGGAVSDPPRRPPPWVVLAVVAVAGVVLGSGVLGGDGDRPGAPAPTIPQPPQPAEVPAPVPGPVVPVDLAALPVPVALAAGDPGGAGLWILRPGTMHVASRARPSSHRGDRPDVQWWGDEVAYVAGDRLWLVDPDGARPPRQGGRALYLVPSDSRDHLWVAQSSEGERSLVEHRHAPTGRSTTVDVPYGAWVAIGSGDRLLAPDRQGAWRLAVGEDLPPLAVDRVAVPSVGRGGLVFFSTAGRPAHLRVTIVDVATGGSHVHDLSALDPDGAVFRVCPSPDGSRYAVDLGRVLAVVRTDGPQVVVHATVQTSTVALAWADADRLLHLGPVPPGAGPRSAQQLSVVALGPDGAATQPVAQVVGAGPWAMATPDGTC